MGKGYIYFLFFIIIIFSLLTLLISVNKIFDGDEFEHIHSAWYIENHYVPYSDFFEHHHPLLWYLLLPFLLFLGNSTDALIAMRLMMFILTMGIAFSTYLITQKITKSTEAGLTSMILLLSMVIFVERSVEIRPDVPQVFFGLASLYYLLRFFQSNKNKYVIFAGFSSALSLLFLQKAIFLLIAYVCIFTFKLFKRELSIKSVFYFTISFSLPLLFFLRYLIISRSFNEYIVANWIVNRALLGISPLLTTLKQTKILNSVNGLFWLFSAVSIVSILLSKKTNGGLKAIAFISLVLSFSIFCFNKGDVYTQYLMPVIPLLCIAIAYFLKISCDRLNVNVVGKVILIFLFIHIPLYRQIDNSRMIKGPAWRVQFERINFVTQNSADSELMYCYTPGFNLFRHDLHYLWFYRDWFHKIIEGENMKTYKKVISNKYGVYDICELIKSKKPKFIEKRAIKECPAVEKLYSATAYQGLYIRKTGINFADESDDLNNVIKQYSDQEIINLDINEVYSFKLKDGSEKAIRLISISEYRDTVIGKVRWAEVDVEIDGKPVQLVCAPYVMPTEIDGIRIQADTAFGLINMPKRVQFSIWDATDPIVNAENFIFPIQDYLLFSQGMQSYNEIVHLGWRDDNPKGAKFYHDYGIDFLGYEGKEKIISCADGEIVSLNPAEGDVCLKTDNGLVWHYGHLDSIHPNIRKGVRVRRGQLIGVLGKKGESGNFSHVHLGTSSSETYQGVERNNVKLNLYPWIVATYQKQYRRNTYAVAGAHQTVSTGEKVLFDGSNSLAFGAKIISYKWVFHDGEIAEGVKAEKIFDKPGVYIATLWIKGEKGNVDVDFCKVKVFTKSKLEPYIPTIFMSYTPTLSIKVGEPVLFRIWLQGESVEHLTVDFGDGKVVDDYIPYSGICHKFQTPGIHIVTASTTIKDKLIMQKLKVIVNKKVGGSLIFKLFH